MPSGRFYCPGLTPGLVLLPEEEAHHAARVLRMRSGDCVELFNGMGIVADGVIELISRQSVGIRVEQIQTRPFELRHHLTLAVAMAKSHRQGFLIEKCTELGVGAIWPILATRSVTQPGEAAVEKWSRRAMEAAKQSGRSWVPVIAPVATFSQAVARTGEFDLAVITDLDAQTSPLLRVLESKQATKVVAFVGPEGGWTDDERAIARAAGLSSVSLAPTILRAETAAVSLCALIASQG